jgi:hypothetical protein
MSLHKHLHKDAHKHAQMHKQDARTHRPYGEGRLCLCNCANSFEVVRSVRHILLTFLKVTLCNLRRAKGCAPEVRPPMSVHVQYDPARAVLAVDEK